MAQSIDRTRCRIADIRHRCDEVELYNGRRTHLDDEHYILKLLEDVQLQLLEGGASCRAA